MNTRNRSAVAWRKADWEGTAKNAKQLGIQNPKFSLNQNYRDMKNILKALLLIFVVGAFFSACQKEVVVDNFGEIYLKSAEVTHTETWDGIRGTDSERCDKLGESPERTADGWIHWIFSTKGTSTDAELILGGMGSGTYAPGDPLDAAIWHFFTPFFELEGLTATINLFGGDPGTGGGLVLSDYCPGECWEGETAWAANGDTPGFLRYTPRGNWATYVAYANAEKTVTLFADQTINAGTVTFSAPDADGKVTITIGINAGWRIEDIEEAVQIQGYAFAPIGNPSPGLFTTYKGGELTVTVDQFAFYGVHVNVEQLVPCPE